MIRKVFNSWIYFQCFSCQRWGKKTSRSGQKTFEINRHENVDQNRLKKSRTIKKKKTCEIQFLQKLRASTQKKSKNSLKSALRSLPAARTSTPVTPKIPTPILSTQQRQSDYPTLFRFVSRNVILLIIQFKWSLISKNVQFCEKSTVKMIRKLFNSWKYFLCYFVKNVG